MPARRRLNREESKAKTRDDLLRAAGRLFLRNGFVDTSLADIAEEAGLTKGAVYSNFEGKEDLFLALLRGETGRPYAVQDDNLSPLDVPDDEGGDDVARARSWGAHLATKKPALRHVALFLEMSAFALRNERARKATAKQNDAYFTELGGRLADLLGAPEADAWLLGLVSQSLYVGLVMHASYDGEPDPDVFARAFESLAAVARASSHA